MKTKVRKKWTEQNNSGYSNRKYSIRGFKRHLPGAALIFWKQKWNCRLAQKSGTKELQKCPFVNTPSQASSDTYPMLLLFLFLLLYFLWCCCIDCLKISAIRKWKWRLVENGRNKKMEEALIVNTPLWDWMALTLWCCCCFYYIFCAVAEYTVWIKTVPLNL